MHDAEHHVHFQASNGFRASDTDLPYTLVVAFNKSGQKANILVRLHNTWPCMAAAEYTLKHDCLYTVLNWPVLSPMHNSRKAETTATRLQSQAGQRATHGH